MALVKKSAQENICNNKSFADDLLFMYRNFSQLFPKSFFILLHLPFISSISFQHLIRKRNQMERAKQIQIKIQVNKNMWHAYVHIFFAYQNYTFNTNKLVYLCIFCLLVQIYFFLTHLHALHILHCKYVYARVWPKNNKKTQRKLVVNYTSKHKWNYISVEVLDFETTIIRALQK